MTIGPQTTAAARAAGLEVVDEARHAGRLGPRRLRRGLARFITFLTDFGLQDDFVGTCHGVMKRIAPEVEIIDITHGIAPQGVLQGALTTGEHAAVHAGRECTLRSSIRASEGRDAPSRSRREPAAFMSGPDNGLLILAVEKLGGIAEAHELA